MVRRSTNFTVLSEILLLVFLEKTLDQRTDDLIRVIDFFRFVDLIGFIGFQTGSSDIKVVYLVAKSLDLVLSVLGCIPWVT